MLLSIFTAAYTESVHLWALVSATYSRTTVYAIACMVVVEMVVKSCTTLGSAQYNRYVRPLAHSESGWNHMVYFNHILHIHACQHSPTTGMRNHYFDGRRFAKHQSSLLWSVRKKSS